jgi:endo-1,4-beta-xylanase
MGISALGMAGAALLPTKTFGTPMIRTDNPRIVFRAFPHAWMPPINWVYATGDDQDPFQSSMHMADEGVIVPRDFERDRFGVNARWFVPGFGFVWLEADNGGDYYSRREIGQNTTLNLNHEFARSRVVRNRRVYDRYAAAGTPFSREVQQVLALSEELFADAERTNGMQAQAALADRALLHALRVGEKIELEHARHAIASFGHRECEFGCETRQYVWAKSQDTIERFADLFTYATITHYVYDTWYELFEPEEGVYNWGIKENTVQWLKRRNITPQGRPILWFHPWVTPDWLKTKNYDELRRYADNHTRTLVGHYGDDILAWETVNEYHDWANLHQHTPEQITEMIRLVNDVTHEVNPKVTRIINNCCTWSNYAASGYNSSGQAPRPLRSVHRFTKDLVEAGVDFEVLGLQIYFPQRDLSDIVRHVERFKEFGKPIYITEIGASSGLSTAALFANQQQIPQQPYDWHRHWDDELQSDWLEQAYSVFYAMPEVKAINWYDFTDFRPFVTNGGLIREDATTKKSFHRMHSLLDGWGHLPGQKRRAQASTNR